MNEDRFWSRVDKSGDCWLWTGQKRNSYGYMWIDGVRHSVHRLSYSIHNGPIPEDDTYHGQCVLHSCDNPSCVNPSHLRLGTQADNMQDMVDRGRHINRTPKGSMNGAAKISESDVIKIRSLQSEGLTHITIAERFGVSRTQISKILRGEYWAQVA